MSVPPGGPVGAGPPTPVDETRRFLGVANIRPRLNEYLMARGGRIGYGVRPSERGKGYATEMLRLALGIAAKMGLERVLLICDKRNIASARLRYILPAPRPKERSRSMPSE